MTVGDSAEIFECLGYKTNRNDQYVLVWKLSKTLVSIQLVDSGGMDYFLNDGILWSLESKVGKIADSTKDDEGSKIADLTKDDNDSKKSNVDDMDDKVTLEDGTEIGYELCDSLIELNDSLRELDDMSNEKTIHFYKTGNNGNGFNFYAFIYKDDPDNVRVGLRKLAYWGCSEMQDILLPNKLNKYIYFRYDCLAAVRFNIRTKGGNKLLFVTRSILEATNGDQSLWLGAILMTLCSSKRIDFIVVNRKTLTAEIVQYARTEICQNRASRPDIMISAEEFKNLNNIVDDFAIRHSLIYDPRMKVVRDIKSDPERRLRNTDKDTGSNAFIF